MTSDGGSTGLAGTAAALGGLAESCAAFAEAFARFDAAFDEAAARTGSHTRRLPPGVTGIARRPDSAAVR